MSPLADSPEPSTDEDPVLANLVEELTARLQAGKLPDGEALAREHPAHAEPLLQLLPALQALAQAGVERRSGKVGRDPALLEASVLPSLFAALGCLGDFLLLREGGRGGMGVVYEAVQL